MCVSRYKRTAKLDTLIIESNQLPLSGSEYHADKPKLGDWSRSLPLSNPKDTLGLCYPQCLGGV